MRLQASCSVVMAVVGVALLAAPATVLGRSSAQLTVGATLAQRHEAARALVPLLKGVKARAKPGPSVRPGTAPDSPFTGTQTTLFAFTISKRSVPVDPRVVTALDRLLTWNIGANNDDENSKLFDRWLVELEARSSRALQLKGEGLCNVGCVVTRMSTLDGTWGNSPKNRAEVRDELLLEALRVAVLSK